MPKVYNYLSSADYQDVWVNGGKIPITAASTYKSDLREGTMTPDENLIHESPIDLYKIPGISIAPGAQIHNFNMAGWQGNNGEILPTIENARLSQENGAILSFSKRLDIDIMRRLGKVCCVRILDVHRLKWFIDKQVGVKSVMGNCNYTSGHRRHHFLKSELDKWQKEYRIFWKDVDTTWVTIPAGIAEVVPM